MLVTGVPRKLICVASLALSLDGAGETVTFVPGSRELPFSCAGRHAGDAPLGGTTVCAPEMLPVANRIATAIHADAATPNTMLRRTLTRVAVRFRSASRYRARSLRPCLCDRTSEQLRRD